MKTRIHYLLLMMVMLIGMTSRAQFIEYERDSKWNIGINMGGVWQDADINLDRPGFGYGFTFGRSIYESPGRMFGLDWRFRYLRGHTYGLDPERIFIDSATYDGYYSDNFPGIVDSGYTYLNNKTDIHDYSLEAVLKFHRLRESTGILFHVFGGVGITDYQTKMNFTDDNNALGTYNYAGLPLNGDFASSQHENLLDGSYETNAPTHEERQIKFMPSLGIGIGYQFGPSFSVGLEHRATFTMYDDFDGHAAPGSEFLNLSSGNDVYHYSALNLRWNILRAEQPDEVYNPPVDCDKPYANFVTPRANEKFQTQYISISAKVSRINSNNDVVLKVNGIPVTTQYSTSTELLTANATLNEGSNTIELIASNKCGKTIIRRTVSFEEKICLKPNVSITQPIGGIVNQKDQSLSGIISNLNGGTIEVALNGKKVLHSYNSSTQQLGASLSLIEGNNTVSVKATNVCGDTTVFLNIQFKDIPCVSPLVSIINPINGMVTQSSALNFSAQVANVKDQSKIILKHNGVQKSFSFNNSSNLLSAPLRLALGSNTIEISASNECGSDIKMTTIVYEKVPCKLPVVSIVSPANGQRVLTSQISLNASILNLVNPSQASVMLNGVQIASSFSTSSTSLSATLNLTLGTNTIVVKGQNDCGVDEKVITIVYEKAPCKLPVVTVISPINGQKVTTPTINLNASVSNLTSSNQVTVLLNGSAVGSNFNVGSGILTTPLNLNLGSNVITVRGQNNCGTDEKVISVVYEKLPCLAPVITFVSPQNGQVFTTGSVNVTASVANVIGGNQVTAKVNGVNTSISYNSVARTVSFSAGLKPGNNTIEVIGTNNCGTVTKSIVVTYECPRPSVNIISPANGIKLTTNSLALSALVNQISNNNDIVVKLNGSVKAFSYNSTTKTLSSNLVLNKGTNIIEVAATTFCGTDNKSITVTYEQPCNAPVVNVIAPVSGQNFSLANIALSGTIDHIERQNQVTVTLNGKAIPGSLLGKNLSAAMTLIKGLNTIVVSAANDCGTDSKTITVTYDAPCPSPAVTFVAPINGQLFTTKTVNFVANVSNITSSSQVILSLNGQLVAGTYSAGTKQVTANLSLIEGNNTIKIIAQNDCGKDEKSINVTFECNKPKINFIDQPNRGVAVSATASIVSKVTHVSSGSQIEVKLNGVAIAHNFNPTTQLLSITTTLKTGKNTISVKATNDCGSDEQVLVINYNPPCDKPVVSISSPIDGTTVSVAKISIAGVALNTASKSEVEVKVNSVAQSITYNASTKTYSLMANLKEGINAIVVFAKNSCGTASKSITITYKRPCEKPTATFVAPKAGQVFSGTTATFSIQTTNVRDASGIMLGFNGAKLTNFNFNSTTGLITGTVNIVNGKNFFNIEVRNECGESVGSLEFTKSAPCPKPIVSISSPINGHVSKVTTVEVKGIVQNINTKSELTVKVNGISQSFNYNTTTKAFDLNVSLREGVNAVHVVAKTSCGTDSKSITITYKRLCEKPTATFVAPKAGQVFSGSTTTYSIQTTNVRDASGIMLGFNGAKLTNFNFNSTTGLITGTVNLVNGKNFFNIEVRNECGESVGSLEFTKSAPCPKPIVSISYPINGLVSKVTTVGVKGIVQNINTKSELTVKVNGISQSFSYNTTTKAFDLNVSLREGVNTVHVAAKTNCGKDSKSITITYKKPCERPTATFVAPKAGQVFSGSTTTYSIQTTNVRDVSGIMLGFNGAKLTSFNFNSTTGLITGTVNLVNGKNFFNIEVRNECGESVGSLEFAKSAPCPKPTVNIISPVKGQATTVNTVQIKGVAQNINAKSELTVKVDGISQVFNYNATTKAFDLNASLKEGVNRIVVEVTNNCGTDSRTLVVNYAKPCDLPIVTIGSPANGTTISSSTILVNGVARNTASQAEVTIKVNGVNQTFNYNFKSKVYDFTAALREGVNAIVVSAKTGCGSDSKTLQVTYRKPCSTPIVTLASPTNGTTISTNQVVVNGVARNTASQSEVTIKVNGRNQTFNYNFKSKVYSFNASLKEGVNTISVSASNGCGSDSKTVTVTYKKPCETPKVEILSPKTGSVSKTKVNFTIRATGARSSSDVKITLNGKVVPHKFNGASKMITGSVTGLKDGSNQLEVELNNGCGIAKESVKIKKKVEKPVIIITYPTSSSSKLSVPQSRVSATIQKIQNQNQVQVKVNGKTFTGTVIRAVSGSSEKFELNAEVPLKVGKNTIVIEATNSYGQRTSKSIEVEYKTTTNNNTEGTSGGTRIDKSKLKGRSPGGR